MTDQQQQTGEKTVVEQEPLTGLNIISDATTTSNPSTKSTALAEVDPNSMSHVNSSTSISIQSKSTADPKKVSIAEPKEDPSGINEDLEVTLPEGEDHDHRLDDDVGEGNMQMAVAEKKKKSRKKKPKSQRGLVRF